MATFTEKEVKIKQVEKLHLMGFKPGEIAKALNISIKTVERYKEEIYREVKEGMKDSDKLTHEILNNYNRLLEEAWKVYEKEEKNKVGCLNSLSGILNSKSDRLAKLGFLKEKPIEFNIKQENEMSIPELVMLCKKINNIK